MLLAAILPLVTRRTCGCHWSICLFVEAILAQIVLQGHRLSTLSLNDVLALELPRSRESINFALASCLEFLALICETRGYQLSTGKVQMLRYVEIPTAYFLQVVLLHQGIAWSSGGGTSLILLQCMMGAIEDFQ